MTATISEENQTGVIDSSINEKVIELDQNRTIDVYDDDENIAAIVKEAVEELKKQYPKMFSKSLKCRVPNVNLEKLSDNIIWQYNQRGIFWEKGEEMSLL